MERDGTWCSLCLPQEPRIVLRGIMDSPEQPRGQGAGDGLEIATFCCCLLGLCRGGRRRQRLSQDRAAAGEGVGRLPSERGGFGLLEPPAMKGHLLPGSRGKGVDVRDLRLEALVWAQEGTQVLLSQFVLSISTWHLLSSPAGTLNSVGRGVPWLGSERAGCLLPHTRRGCAELQHLPLAWARSLQLPSSCPAPMAGCLW